MLWFHLSLATALFLSTTDALSKRALKGGEVELVAWVRWAFAALLLLLLLPFIEIPRLDATFWLVTTSAVPLEVAAILLYVKAIKSSPLSLTVPFLAFTPLFLILTSFVMLGELPDASGVAGIVLITFGAYLLNIKRFTEGWLAPFKSIAREKGSVMMIVVAFIYSITSNLGKVAVLHSSPAFFAVLYSILLAAALTPVVMMKVKDPFSYLMARPVLFVMIGLFYGLMMLTHFAAIRLVEVPYMISVKRMSLVFSVLYGRFFFKEENVGERLLGSAVMVAGVALIMV